MYHKSRATNVETLTIYDFKSCNSHLELKSTFVGFPVKSEDKNINKEDIMIIADSKSCICFSAKYDMNLVFVCSILSCHNN